MKKRILKLSLFFAMLWALLAWWQDSITTPSLEAGPVQRLCLHLPIKLKGHRIQPVMSYAFTGRIVSTKTYQDTDFKIVSPVDLGVAWGETADPEKLKTGTFRQSKRFMHWHYPKKDNYNSEEIANCHIIPATDEIKIKALSAARGDIVALRGYLVNVDDSWRSSLTRKDHGDGACEVIYVTDLQLVKPTSSDSKVTSGFNPVPTTLTEKDSGRKTEVVIIARKDQKIAFMRKQDRRLFVIAIDRLAQADQKWLSALPEGGEVVLNRIDLGLYRQMSDIP